MTKFLELLNKLKPERIFLLFALLFGLIFLFITPIFQVPDEPMHLLRACEVANLIIHNNKDGDISKDFLPNKKFILKEKCSCFQAFKDKKHYTELFEFKELNYTHNNSGYSFLLYLPSAVGIKISSLITSNPYIQFYAGRLFNFLSFLCLTFIAIKITPRFKWTFLITALFPMTLYEGMSLSADSINLGLAFLYIAYIFHLAYGKKDAIQNKETSVLIFLSFLTIFSKGLFILTFLSFLIPKEKLKNKFILIPALITVIIFLQALLSTYSYILIANGVNPEARKAMILHTPLYTIKLFINTLIHKTTFYVQSSIFRLGWLEIEPNPTAVISLFFCYLTSAVLLENHKYIIYDKLLSASVCISYVILTLLLYFLTFSPLDCNIIIGAQGRYFIPLYLIFAITLQGAAKPLGNKASSVLKAIILLTIILNFIYASYLIRACA